ncbi:MAG: hypothetical protein IJR49_03275, partial [Treponema sp.]|nr:hypothetical protein [Treponema sp.]
MLVSGGNVLKQFQNLQQFGLLSSFEDLNRENKELQRIISDMTLLATYTDADSMMNFLISRFLDYFIPQSLVFIIKQPRTDFI